MCKSLIKSLSPGIVLTLFVAPYLDRTGDELTPGAKYDFKFKDYAPWVFRHLREQFGIDPADYLVSIKKCRRERF